MPPTIQRTIDRSWAATAISGVLATVVVTLGAVYFAAQLFTAPAAGSPGPMEKPSIQKASPAAFDVILVDGVSRDQAGRLSISGDGVRFRENENGHGSLEVSCGDIRKISTATMIADREQRLLEITLTGQAYRLRAADTPARDSIRGALARSCGSH